jgi:hypothetical protein
MNNLPHESRFQRTIGWITETLAMVFLSLMALVSTLRLFGIVS